MKLASGCVQGLFSARAPAARILSMGARALLILRLRDTFSAYMVFIAGGRDAQLLMDRLLLSAGAHVSQSSEDSATIGQKP